MIAPELMQRLSSAVSEATEAPTRPPIHDTGDCAMYLRSYLWLRIVVGIMGVGLPFLLILVDHFLLGGPWHRTSLSAYYHSGMRDAYVSVLLITGVVLITYKVAERSLNNLASLVAGIAVIVVALAPTALPEGCGPSAAGPSLGCPSPTGLQMAFGEARLSHIHQGASIIFIVLMGVLTVFFGASEGKRSARPTGREQLIAPGVWRMFHWTMAGCMAAMGVFHVVTGLTGLWSGWALTFTEVVCTFAFGLSWLMKGLERPYLLPSRLPAPRPAVLGVADVSTEPSPS